VRPARTLYGARRLAGRAGGLDARPRCAQLRRTSQPPSRATPVGNLTRDEVLDNINDDLGDDTASRRPSLLGEHPRLFDVKGATVPVAVSVFPKELYQAPRSWAEQAYPNLIYFNGSRRGQPLRRPGRSRTSSRPRCGAGFRSLRNGGSS